MEKENRIEFPEGYAVLDPCTAAVCDSRGEELACWDEGPNGWSAEVLREFQYAMRLLKRGGPEAVLRALPEFRYTVAARLNCG